MERKSFEIRKKIIAIVLVIIINVISFSNIVFAADLTATAPIKGVVKTIGTEEETKKEKIEDYEIRNGSEIHKLDDTLNIYGSEFSKSEYVEYIEEIELDSKNISESGEYKVYVNQRSESLEASDCTYTNIISNKKINEEGKLILTIDEPIKLMGEKFALAVGCPEEQEEVNIAAKVRVTTSKILGTIARIGMRTVPNKNIYTKGEELDLSGATIMATDTKGGTQLIPAEHKDVKITGYNKEKVGIQTINVEYQGKQTKFYVTVKENKESKMTAEPSEIANEIKNDSMLETSGEVKTDNNIRIIDNKDSNKNVITPTPEIATPAPYNLSPATPDTSTSNKSTIVTKVEFAKEPTKKVYYQGVKDLDFNGGILKITYSDGRTENWSISRNSDKWKNVNSYSVDTSKIGTQTVQFNYAGKIATYNITIRKPNVTKVEFVKTPTKTIYVKGENNLNFEGGILKITYENGTLEHWAISNTSEKWKNVNSYSADTSKVGTQIVYFNYAGKVAYYTITVREPKVKNISFLKEPTKKSYYQGAKDLDFTGGILRINYENGTSENWSISRNSTKWRNVNSYSVDTSKLGTQTVQFNYAGKIATYIITVRKANVSSVSFAKLPTKTTYYQGVNDLDFTGGILKINYESGTSENWTITRNSEKWLNVDSYSFDSSKLGVQRIAFNYSGKTAYYNINIRKPNVTGISFIKVPTKTTYNKNETLDVTGGILKINYENGTSENWTISRNSTKWNNVNYYSGNTSKEGKQTVAFVYCNKVAYYTITVKDNSPKSLTISKMPTKTIYNVGENLNLTGGVLKISYADGRVGTISMSSNAVTKSKFDSSTPGIKIIKLTYKGLSTNISLTVKNNNQKVVKSISIAQIPNGTIVKKGTKLNLNGGTLRVTYSDGTSKVISMKSTGVTTSYIDTSTSGTKIMTITYAGKSTTLKIIVQSDKVAELKVTKLPTKTVYNIGEKLDLSGGCIQANYDDNTGTAFSMISAGVSTRGFNSTTEGVKTIYITYGGKTASFNVKVVDNRSTTVKSIAVAQKPATLIKKGSTLNLTGGTLKVKYGDGRTSTISMKAAGVTTSYIDTSTSGTKIITIYYKGKSTTLKIIVQSDKVVELKVTRLPAKTVYNIGEKLDLSGGCIQANYDDNTGTAFSMKSAGVSTRGFNSTTEGVKTIYITYGGKTASFKVTVKGKNTAVQEFNAKFTQSAGVKTGAQVKTLIQNVISSNSVGTNPKISVTFSAGTAIAKYTGSQISKGASTIKSNNKYSVSFNYDAQGYINNINISQK